MASGAISAPPATAFCHQCTIIPKPFLRSVTRIARRPPRLCGSKSVSSQSPKTRPPPTSMASTSSSSSRGSGSIGCARSPLSRDCPQCTPPLLTTATATSRLVFVQRTATSFAFVPGGTMTLMTTSSRSWLHRYPSPPDAGEVPTPATSTPVTSRPPFLVNVATRAASRASSSPTVTPPAEAAVAVTVVVAVVGVVLGFVGRRGGGGGIAATCVGTASTTVSCAPAGVDDVPPPPPSSAFARAPRLSLLSSLPSTLPGAPSSPPPLKLGSPYSFECTSSS
mmetsp:Transcript_8724/g.21576  ORF Transcript_8724/g.21576 Transcript_8724/m.21576 type:complete len:280 (-) Transcript_8724:338-1177(-)